LGAFFCLLAHFSVFGRNFFFQNSPTFTYIGSM
jgi:hypothetical protein